MEVETKKRPTIDTPERWEVVRRRQSGETYEQISSALKCSKSSALEIYKKFESFGHVKDRPRSGRPQSLTSRQERAVIQEALKRNDKSLRELAKTAVPGKVVSHTLIMKTLRLNNILTYKPAIKYEISPANIQKRFEFALKYRSWNVDDWSAIIFSDETMWDNIPYKKQLRRQKSDPKMVLSATSRGSHPIKVMVWGAISIARQSSLYRIQGIITGETYKELLETNLIMEFAGLSNQSLTFQQDNAPVHTAKVVKEFLKESKIKVLEWPPQSPDLNPIENLWAIMKRRISTDVKNEAELLNEVKNVWSKIEPELLYNLYRSMPARIEEVIRKKGGNTSF
jgi:transposase